MISTKPLLSIVTVMTMTTLIFSCVSFPTITKPLRLNEEFRNALNSLSPEVINFISSQKAPKSNFSGAVLFSEPSPMDNYHSGIWDEEFLEESTENGVIVKLSRYVTMIDSQNQTGHTKYKKLVALNGLLTPIHTYEYTSDDELVTGISYITKIVQISQNIFPLTVGKSFTLDFVYHVKSNYPDDQDSNSKDVFHVISERPAKDFMPELPGSVYLLRKSSLTQYSDGRSNEYTNYVYYSDYLNWAFKGGNRPFDTHLVGYSTGGPLVGRTLSQALEAQRTGNFSVTTDSTGDKKN